MISEKNIVKCSSGDSSCIDCPHCKPHFAVSTCIKTKCPKVQSSTSCTDISVDWEFKSSDGIVVAVVKGVNHEEAKTNFMRLPEKDRSSYLLPEVPHRRPII